MNEELRLELRFGFERAFLASDLVQLFHRELDLPVQVVAPWIDALPGARVVPLVPPAPGSPPVDLVSFALNEQRAHARRLEEPAHGRTGFELVALERRYLPERAGTLSIPAPSMHFAYATRFREHLFTGRVADDRIEASVRASALELRVLPLPEDGRPAAFSGAVGSFAVHAEADPRDLRAGQSLKLELVIEGSGNFETLIAPRLDRLEGFHVYGKVEERSPGRRRVTYDIAPLDQGVKAVPAIPFGYFDPNPPAGYRSVETRPIPILVRPEPLPPVPAPAPPDTRPKGDAVPIWAWATGAFALALVVWLLRAGRRRQRD